MNENLRKKSKFLSKILRHDPKLVGIALDEKGWAKVSDILMVF